VTRAATEKEKKDLTAERRSPSERRRHVQCREAGGEGGVVNYTSGSILSALGKRECYIVQGRAGNGKRPLERGGGRETAAP